MILPISFGKFCLLERISVGGMAEIYRAKLINNPNFQRYLVIKRILPSLAANKEFIEMFIDEAKISVQLNHPNIAQIYELGRLGKSHFMVMEYIAGRDLLQIQQLNKRRRRIMSVSQACYIISKIAQGLDCAHRAMDQMGQPLMIIHRDVSPQNMLVSYDGDVKLIDFGVAKAASKNSQTQAGVLKGKFGYMSPEQVEGKPIDHRSDIFGLGTVFWELLTGRRLFHDENEYITLEKVRACNVPDPSDINDLVPAEVNRIVMRALQPDPEQRYSFASEMAEELENYSLSRKPLYKKSHLKHWICNAFSEQFKEEWEKVERFGKINTPQDIKRASAEAELAGSSAAEQILDHDGSVVPDLEEDSEFKGESTQVFTPMYNYSNLEGENQGLPAQSSIASFQETSANMAAFDPAAYAAEQETEAETEAPASRMPAFLIASVILFAIVGIGGIGLVIYLETSKPEVINIAPEKILGTIKINVVPHLEGTIIDLLDAKGKGLNSMEGSEVVFSKLALGEYQIRAFHPEYEEVTRPLKLKSEKMKIRMALLQRRSVTATLNVTPTDAEVSFDGVVLQKVSTSWRSIEMTLGEAHQFEISRQGHLSQKMEVTLMPDEPLALSSIVLEKGVAEWTVVVNKPAGIVLRNAEGQEVGSQARADRMSFPALDPTQSYTLEVERSGHKKYVETIPHFVGREGVFKKTSTVTLVH